MLDVGIKLHVLQLINYAIIMLINGFYLFVCFIFCYDF